MGDVMENWETKLLSAFAKSVGKPEFVEWFWWMPKLLGVSRMWKSLVSERLLIFPLCLLFMSCDINKQPSAL